MFKTSLVKLGKTEKKRLKEFIRSQAYDKLMMGTRKEFEEYKRIKEIAIYNCIWESKFKID
jgi:hypothetical protein